MKEQNWSKFWLSLEQNHPTVDGRVTPTIDTPTIDGWSYLPSLVGLGRAIFVIAFLGGNLLCKKEPKPLNAWVYRALFFIGSSLEVEASNSQ
ncbi:hypothetical protein M9H77_06820 [Catharanthus roseus]|uniref:Uncharacterized protein n=1 Tax=Catharanthus roseus TaxID=4058 RepID=A0ACC0BTC1_CATRO|nr:hypothetical protein M9H77_06820 [Catharanthus roseus]